jgi:hypothetical protein
MAVRFEKSIDGTSLMVSYFSDDYTKYVAQQSKLKQSYKMAQFQNETRSLQARRKRELLQISIKQKTNTLDQLKTQFTEATKLKEEVYASRLSQFTTERKGLSIQGKIARRQLSKQIGNTISAFAKRGLTKSSTALDDLRAQFRLNEELRDVQLESIGNQEKSTKISNKADRLSVQQAFDRQKTALLQNIETLKETEKRTKPILAPTPTAVGGIVRVAAKNPYNPFSSGRTGGFNPMNKQGLV